MTARHFDSVELWLMPGGRLHEGAAVDQPPPDPGGPGESEGRLGEHHFVVRPLEAYGRELGRVRWLRRGAPDGAALQAVDQATEFLGRLLTFEYELDALSAELADSYESINMIYDLSEEADSVATSAEMCDQLLGALARQLSVRAGCVLLTDERSVGTGWTVQAVHGELPGFEVGSVVPLEGQLQSEVAQASGLLVDRIGEGPGAEFGSPLLDRARRNLLGVPLRSGSGTAHGGLILFDRQDPDGSPRLFTAQDRKFAETVATQGTAMIRGMRMAEFNKEMEIGRRIQQSLLPASVPQTESVAVAGLCSMARVVGGDLYDAAIGPGGELRAVIADVSGHDLGSALLMAAARAHFRAELRGEAGPAEVVDRVNRLLYEDLSSAGLFLTFFVVTYRPEEGLLRYSAGGHNPMILLRSDRDQAELLEAPGMPAGLTEEGHFPERAVPFGPGDLLLLYTDGLTEAARPDGAMFGEEGLGRALTRLRGREPGEILARIEAEIQEFTGAKVLQDDGTALLLKGVGSRTEVSAQAGTPVESMGP